MSLPFQPGLRRALALLGMLWLVSAGSTCAASPGENRAFGAAVKSFQDEIWGRAEEEFAQFVVQFPQSERVPEAVLRQAQAQFHQGRFPSVIALLTARLSNAGALADRYLFWIGEAHFQSGDFAAAADTYGRIAREFADSPRGLEATVGEAAARARLGQWPRVIASLTRTNGAFQTAALARPELEAVTRGRLLLAEARMVETKFAEAEAVLHPLDRLVLPPELDWQRRYLLCRALLGGGKTADALRVAEGLGKLAKTTGRRDLPAQSAVLLASIHEQLGQADNAIAVLNQNLAADAPVNQQRHALLKIADLSVARGHLAGAVETLEQFLSQFSNAPAADAALLTLGELHLKQHQARTNGAEEATTVTNHLQLALEYFDRLLATHTNSTFAGQAQLGRGWCLWLGTNLPASAEAFRAAAAALSVSEDLAVARFKLADAFMAQNDYAAALPHYTGALEIATNLPAARESLVPRILYQLARAHVALTNATGASAAMRQLLHWPAGRDEAARSVLLVGQSFLDAGEAATGRALFQDFAERFPEAEERPVVELLMARALEQTRQWSNAVALYDGWVERFASNRLRPDAEFHRALALFHAGDSTNALKAFSSFIARFAAHPLAPPAQWWVASYHFDRGEFLEAEKGFKNVFQSWPDAELARPAQLMAGRAALARPDYGPAIEHFTLLTSDTNCPPDLRTDAMFAYGGALMLRNGGDSNDPTADLKLAIKVFGTVRDEFPASDQAAQAWGEMAKCYLQIGMQDPGSYRLASNACQQAILMSNATVTTRSQAQVALGSVLEAQARLMSGEEQAALLKAALDQYLDVLYEKNLHGQEQPDRQWVKKAGLEAARMAELTQQWPPAVKIYRRLQELFPPLRESLERRIQKAQEHLALGKN